MFNLNIFKKHKTLSLSALRKESISPNNVWIIILAVASICIILTTILSGYTSTMILNDKIFDTASTQEVGRSINADRLNRAVEIIQSRGN